MTPLEMLEDLKNTLGMYCTTARPHDFYDEIMKRLSTVIDLLKNPIS